MEFSDGSSSRLAIQCNSFQLHYVSFGFSAFAMWKVITRAKIDEATEPFDCTIEQQEFVARRLPSIDRYSDDNVHFVSCCLILAAA